MKRIVRLAAVALMLATCAACDGLGFGPDREQDFNRVFILYSLGFNNLSGDLNRNIDTFCEGDVPSKSSRDAVVVFSHSVSNSYSTPTRPVIYRLYKESGSVVRDTLGYFHPTTTSASTEMMGDALNYIREQMPSKSYSMLLTSHATGWIKPNWTYSGGITTLSRKTDSIQWPETKSVGASFSNDSSGKLISTEMELKAFAAAIPMHLDFIIFDACLMGGIEAAYELKDVADRIVFSPTEVLTEGFCYKPMPARIFGGAEADLAGMAEDYFNQYIVKSGRLQSASISVVDCRHLDNLATVMNGIISAHRGAFSSNHGNGVQRYFYASPGDSRYKPWYYDLRDAASVCGASSQELAELDAALTQCVEYHAETPKFFDLTLSRCCGMSMYMPNPSWTELNDYYRTLSWNSATGLVE